MNGAAAARIWSLEIKHAQGSALDHTYHSRLRQCCSARALVIDLESLSGSRTCNFGAIIDSNRLSLHSRSGHRGDRVGVMEAALVPLDQKPNQTTAWPIDLLSRARLGDTEALGELCAFYRNYLRMVARSGLGTKLRERVELSDVVQEVLVDVVRQFPQFAGETEAAVMGWMRRLVGQRLADLARYHRRVKRAGDGMAVRLDGAPDSGGLPQGDRTLSHEPISTFSR
jgi:ECF sigma factor